MPLAPNRYESIYDQMKILGQWKEKERGAPLHLVIGAFDGIHKGHQMLIRTALDQAVADGGEAWLLTFDPHPSRVLRPEQSPPLLSSTAHKLRLLQSSGLTGVIIQPFTEELSQLSPEAFLDQLCEALPDLKTITVGTNWRFGHRAAGDVQRLQELSSAYGFKAVIPPPLEADGDIISSTRIRTAIESGDLDAAEAMLGRQFSMLGTVTTGRQYGRELGFPTANIKLQDEARPPTGVYAVYGIYKSDRHNGAAYLGIRPTSHGEHTHHLLEVHLFDVNIDLYGRDIEVFFVKRLRADKFFDNHDELKAQIGRDVQSARAVFG